MSRSSGHFNPRSAFSGRCFSSSDRGFSSEAFPAGELQLIEKSSERVIITVKQCILLLESLRKEAMECFIIKEKRLRSIVVYVEG